MLDAPIPGPPRTPVLHTCASSYAPDAHVCKHGPIFAETILLARHAATTTASTLRGIGCRRGARGCAVACPRRSERDRATISAARWSLKSLRSCLAPRCARGSHRGQSQPLAPHKVRRGSVKPDIFLLRARLELIPVELLARTPRMRMECFSSTVDSVPDPRPRGDLR